jgi:sister-chromatid-cohesion protein PDS5
VLAAYSGSTLAVQYRNLFAEFIRRFKDKQMSIRLNMLQWAQTFLLVMDADPVLEAVEGAVHSLVLDFEETVRIAACGVLCDVAATKPAAVPKVHLQVQRPPFLPHFTMYG